MIEKIKLLKEDRFIYTNFVSNGDWVTIMVHDGVYIVGTK